MPAAARVTLGRHELNGWIVAAVFVALLFWKGWYRGEVPTPQRKLYAAAELVGVGLVIYGAMLGGRLVYAYGVGTGLAL